MVFENELNIASYVIVTLCGGRGCSTKRFLLQLLYLEMRLNRGDHFS